MHFIPFAAYAGLRSKEFPFGNSSKFIKPLFITALVALIAATGCSSKKQASVDAPQKKESEAVMTPSETVAPDTPIALTHSSENPMTAYRLSNGLEVYLVEKKSIPMATVLIAVKNGAFAENPSNNGLAHLYEHMFFKANEKVPSQPQFLRALDEMGIELGPNMNAQTSTEFVRYYFTLQSQYLERGIQFMADALISPKFLQDELEKERKVVIGEFDRYEASPSDVFFQKSIFGKMFNQYFVRKNTIGDRNVILNASQQQMHDIQHQYYIPNNSALMIVGDFDEASVRQWIERGFGSWAKGDDPFVKYPVPEHPPISANLEFVENASVQTVSMVQGFHGPSLTRNNKDILAMDLASHMLGFESSPFQKELVQSGLASQASFYAWSQRYTSPLLFSVETTEEHAQEVYGKLKGLVEKIRLGKFFTERDLQVAKNSIEVSSAYDRESGQRYAMGLASIWTSTDSLNFYLSYVDEIKKLTLADIDQALQRYLSTNYVLGVLMPQGTKPIQVMGSKTAIQ